MQGHDLNNTQRHQFIVFDYSSIRKSRLGSFVISVLFLLGFRVCLFIDALWLPSGKRLTSWLSFVMSYCQVITFPLVSWVRCSARLYRLLIFDLLLGFPTLIY